MTVKVSQANRGQAFEDLINFANNQYRTQQIALIHKRPTPIKALKTKGSRILSGVYESKSTVDYDGVYQGKALYFEAKSTREKTRFDLSNVSQHQIIHLEEAEKNGAVCFFLIEFAALHEIYFLPFPTVRHYLLNAANGGAKSIPYDDFKFYAWEVTKTKRALLDYLVHVDRMSG
jgi:recombination protein U